MVSVGKSVKPTDCESVDCEFKSRPTPQLYKRTKMKSKIVKYKPIEKPSINVEDLHSGLLVWFVPDEARPRIGLITKIVSRGSNKVDVIWQKSGENYTVKRITIDKIHSKVEFQSVEKEKLAVKNYCERVMKDNANPTGAAIEALKNVVIDESI